MPVRRRKDRRKSAVPEWDIELDLSIGWLSDRSDEEMRDAWERFAPWLMGEYARHRPGMRPAAWWRFERELSVPPGIFEEADLLFAMGELDAAEIEAVRHLWRGYPGGGPKFLEALQ